MTLYTIVAAAITIIIVSATVTLRIGLPRNRRIA
jgi:hypothetical protein